MTHAEGSASLVRPPGHPPSECQGELYRVDGKGMRIGDHVFSYLDDAQPGEDAPHKYVEVRLYRCFECRETLVVSIAHGTGKPPRLRNSWSPKPSLRPGVIA